MRKKKKTVTRGLFRALPVIRPEAEYHIRTLRPRFRGGSQGPDFPNAILLRLLDGQKLCLIFFLKN